MNLTDVFNLLENNEDLKNYLNKIPKKNSRTKVAYLESLSHLGYLLYLDKKAVLAENLLETISSIPFEGDYDYWTFIESSISLLAFIHKTDRNKVFQLKDTILRIFDYGDDSTRRINKNVHNRFWGCIRLAGMLVYKNEDN